MRLLIFHYEQLLLKFFFLMHTHTFVQEHLAIVCVPWAMNQISPSWRCRCHCRLFFFVLSFSHLFENSLSLKQKILIAWAYPHRAYRNAQMKQQHFIIMTIIKHFALNVLYYIIMLAGAGVEIAIQNARTFCTLLCLSKTKMKTLIGCL